MLQRASRPMMRVEIDAGFWAHRKTLKLQRGLRDPEAWRHPIRLWGALAEREHSGFFPFSEGVTRDSAVTSDAAAEIAQLIGVLHRAEEVVGALIDAGFLALEEGGIRAHEWAERLEKYLRAKTGARLRQQKKRRLDRAPETRKTLSRVTDLEEEDHTETGGGAVLPTGQPFLLTPPPPALRASEESRGGESFASPGGRPLERRSRRRRRPTRASRGRESGLRLEGAPGPVRRALPVLRPRLLAGNPGRLPDSREGHDREPDRRPRGPREAGRPHHDDAHRRRVLPHRGRAGGGEEGPPTAFDVLQPERSPPTAHRGPALVQAAGRATGEKPLNGCVVPPPRSSLPPVPGSSTEDDAAEPEGVPPPTLSEVLPPVPRSAQNGRLAAAFRAGAIIGAERGIRTGRSAPALRSRKGAS